EARQLRLAAPARRPEIRPGAGQKDEARRAEVGDPAGEEEKRRGAGEIGRLEQPGIEMKKLADMIEGHDHHDQPADEVDRVESGPGRGSRSDGPLLRQRGRGHGASASLYDRSTSRQEAHTIP